MNPMHRLLRPKHRQHGSEKHESWNAYPCDWDEETCGRADEQHGTDPIHPFQLIGEIARLEIQLQEERDEDKCHSDEG